MAKVDEDFKIASKKVAIEIYCCAQNAMASEVVLVTDYGDQDYSTARLAWEWSTRPGQPHQPVVELTPEEETDFLERTIQWMNINAERLL